jgi:hypothetical protein
MSHALHLRTMEKDLAYGEPVRKKQEKRQRRTTDDNAFNRGRNDRRLHKSLGHNPYKNQHTADQWELGWRYQMGLDLDKYSV